jgi:hypothetical protein
MKKKQKASVLERYATHLGKPEISRMTGISFTAKPGGGVDFLQEAIICRDKKNMGMPRKEIVQTIMDIGGAKYKSAENHYYDYLIRAEKQREDSKGMGYH